MDDLGICGGTEGASGGGGAATGVPEPPFARRLRAAPCLLLDGGLGTMLLARGLPSGTAPERWVLERPDEVRAVHRAYVEAGSEAVHAATFGANPVRLAAAGLEGRCEEVNARAVELARAAGPRWVIADVGPTGEYLPPVGTGDPERWEAAFLRQARALREAGPDAAHLETFSDLREALIALRAVRSVCPGLPVLASLTFDRKRRGFHTIFGDAVRAALAALAAEGALVVGANCTLASPDMRDLAAEARREPLALVLQPNAGQPQAGPGGPRYDQPPEAFAADMEALLTDQAADGERAVGRIVALGGCCGTDPRFIAALRRRLGPAGVA